MMAWGRVALGLVVSAASWACTSATGNDTTDGSSTGSVFVPTSTDGSGSAPSVETDPLPPATTTASDQCDGTGGEWSSGEDGDASGDPPIGMDDDMPLAALVAEIQQDMVPRSTFVLIENVVVTTRSVPTEAEEGFEFFIQDPAGGPWSGLRIRMPSDVALPEVGRAVDVVGHLIGRRGFYLIDTSGTNAEVTDLGPGVMPEPALVDVADLALDDEQGRAYEGVHIRVEQVVVTDEDPCDGEFEIEDTARVDDRFAPGQIEAPPEGSMLAAVEGVLVFAEDALEIAPGSPEDVG
ncbi:MAG: hypothetical protein AAF799_42445 [Myxococcota bacterium]